MRRDALLRRIGIELLAWTLALTIRALGRTWRVRVRGPDPRTGGGSLLGATWHESLIASAFLFRDMGAVIPVSLSRDGDLGTRAARKLGFGEPARGSTSRGPRALLRQMIRRARAGETLAVLPDGPRGPARRLQPGILAVARACGRPVHPFAVAAHPARRLPSWDRTLVPLPFARVSLRFGEPVAVAPRASTEEMARAAEDLSATLDRLREQAELDVAPARALPTESR